MSDINSIVVIGICGKDPEIVEFENDTKLTKMSLGVKRYDKKEKQDITDWLNVETFSKLGEYVKKGTRVCAEGSLEVNTWQNKDGKTVKAYTIKARNIQILTPKKEEQGSQENQEEIII